MTRLISGLSDIAARYDVILSDVWGVIHNGRESFARPCGALMRWQEEHGPVILISNAPRPATDVIPQIDALKVPRRAWTSFVTSGDATRKLLAARAPGPAWRIGPDRDAPLYAGLGVEFSGPDEATFISVTGPDDDETETPEDYRMALTKAQARGLPMICANPDIVVQRGDRLIYCGGALAQLYASLGGETIMAGKPHAPIYDSCLAEAGRLMGDRFDRSRVLAIGDGLHTDVKGANDNGLDVMFVANGIHGAEARGADGKLDPAKVDVMLAEAGVRADYVLADLTW